MSATQRDGTLWDWAVAAYARPGVAGACLHLQDHHGQNVPLLLAAAWAAGAEQRLDVPAAVALAYGWEHDVGGLMRAVRRNLKPARPGVADAAREALRRQVKAVELDGERVLLDALEAMTAAAVPVPVETALTEVSGAWAKAGGFRPPPPQEVNELSMLICYGASR